MTGELGRMIPELIEALGGWLDPAQPLAPPGAHGTGEKSTTAQLEATAAAANDAPPWAA